MENLEVPPNVTAPTTSSATLLIVPLILELLIPFVESLLGVILNTFIVVVNAVGWAKNFQLNSCDLIITCLGFSQVLMQMLNLLPFLVFCCSTCVPWFNRHINVLDVLGLALSYITFWSIACLHVFYCVRITNFRQSSFQHLKARTRQWIPWLLLGCLLVSVLMAVPAPWALYSLHPIFAYPLLFWNTTGNATNYLHLEPVIVAYQVVHYAAPLTLFLFSYVPPFLMCCGAATLLLTSLWQHTRRMALCNSSFRGPNQVAHFKAIKSVSISCCIFAIYFLTTMSSRLHLLWPLCYQIRLCPIILTGFPIFQSLILIFTNIKLRQAAFGILFYCRCKGRRA
ncbi:taste receptor type 2 member 40-like [Microcaecilia unicolor]|uniref:Taste receptor type 2 n=1 Tax=Microcaecilia unicolor TaxID=1415580 RepID=A0A6P7WWT1_9AMPH|nr:taste receptor type 2 member 40-like [Microcaecilia unicolor]